MEPISLLFQPYVLKIKFKFSALQNLTEMSFSETITKPTDIYTYKGPGAIFVSSLTYDQYFTNFVTYGFRSER